MGHRRRCKSAAPELIEDPDAPVFFIDGTLRYWDGGNIVRALLYRRRVTSTRGEADHVATVIMPRDAFLTDRLDAVTPIGPDGPVGDDPIQ